MSYFYRCPGFEVLCSWEKAKNVGRIHVPYSSKEEDSICSSDKNEVSRDLDISQESNDCKDIKMASKRENGVRITTKMS